jgi:hypothetical protein
MTFALHQTVRSQRSSPVLLSQHQPQQQQPQQQLQQQQQQQLQSLPQQQQQQFMVVANHHQPIGQYNIGLSPQYQAEAGSYILAPQPLSSTDNFYSPADGEDIFE